ncbi:hypothetical protein, partial [Staphylococcus aureus]
HDAASHFSDRAVVEGKKLRSVLPVERDQILLGSLGLALDFFLVGSECHYFVEMDVAEEPLGPLPGVMLTVGRSDPAGGSGYGSSSSR